METLPEVAAVLIGFLLRLAIPIGVTLLVAWALRKLDARWQREAEKGAQKTALTPIAYPKNGRGVNGDGGEGLHCWEIRGCPPERRAACLAYAHPETPCWQIFRAPTGQLREDCLDCQLFRDAPLPLAG